MTQVLLLCTAVLLLGLSRQISRERHQDWEVPGDAADASAEVNRHILTHSHQPWQTYLNYIRDLGRCAGFVVADELLRIPSTKNRWGLGPGGRVQNMRLVENLFYRMLHRSRWLP